MIAVARICTSGFRPDRSSLGGNDLMPMSNEQVCDRIGARVSSQAMRRPPYSRMDWILHYLELVWILARKEIKVRYKNSFFGYLWSLVNPLASAAVFYFAFEIVFKTGIPDFVIFLVVGLFVWQWTANYLIGSCDVYIANQNLIKKAVFPRFVLPIVLNVQDTFHFLASVPVIVLLLWWHHVAVEPVILAGVLLVVPAQFLILLGMGFVLSSTNLFFRDMQRILQIGLNIAFYVSPVLYPIDRVPAKFRFMIELNPITPLIETWRQLFLHGVLQWSTLGYVYLIGLVSLTLGTLVYARLSWRFAETL
jgi:lipopolysaccharide transport system permease protein